MAYPANTCRSVFQFGLANGTNGYVTPHFRKSDGGDYTLSELEGLNDLLSDWFTADDFGGGSNEAMKDHMSQECSLQSITSTSLAVGVPVQASLAVNVAGTDVGNPLPNETSLVVTIYTGLVGRSYRGRNFWPGMSTTIMESNGTINSTELASMQQTFQHLLDGIALLSSSELCVNSETLGLSTFASSVLVRDVLHHQRRRNS